VREKLLEYLRFKHPYALPRVATAPAPAAGEGYAQDKVRYEAEHDPAPKHSAPVDLSRRQPKQYLPSETGAMKSVSLEKPEETGPLEEPGVVPGQRQARVDLRRN
jgi:hypothetical protein